MLVGLLSRCVRATVTLLASPSFTRSTFAPGVFDRPIPRSSGAAATETEIFFAWMQRTTPTAQALPRSIQGGQGFYTMSSTVRGGTCGGRRALPVREILGTIEFWKQIVHNRTALCLPLKVLGGNGHDCDDLVYCWLLAVMHPLSCQSQGHVGIWMNNEANLFSKSSHSTQQRTRSCWVVLKDAESRFIKSMHGTHPTFPATSQIPNHKFHINYVPPPLLLSV